MKMICFYDLCQPKKDYVFQRALMNKKDQGDHYHGGGGGLL